MPTTTGENYRCMGAATRPPCPFIVVPIECELTNSAGGLSMNGLFRKLPMIVLLGSLLYSTAGLTQVSPTTEKTAKVRITQGPEIERIYRELSLELNPLLSSRVCFRFRLGFCSLATR